VETNLTRQAVAKSYWDLVQEELAEFQARYEEAQKIDPTTDAGQKLLGQFAFRHNGTVPTSPGNVFPNWLKAAFLFPRAKGLDEMRPDGRLCMEVAEGTKPLSEFLQALETYAEAINEPLSQIAPARLTYHGFTCTNEDRLSDGVVRAMLDGVDYVASLFKKRGMEKLLHQGLKQIILVIWDQVKHDKAVAHYRPKEQVILLTTRILDNQEGLLTWAHDVFLHEFGHHVHLNYMDARAKEVWANGWLDIKSMKSAFDSISRAERDIYFEALKATKFEPSKAVKKLSPKDKVKFGVWLRGSDNGPLVTPKSFKVTEQGKQTFDFFRDEAAYLAENYEWMDKDERAVQAERSRKQMNSRLGLNNSSNLPVPMKIVEDLAKNNPEYKKALKDAFEKLDIVSDYGKTNEMEDFAETFVAFVADTARLTQTAKDRMQQALWLSSFYGKPVIRLARTAILRVAARYEAD
jgi:hypothetical protein